MPVFLLSIFTLLTTFIGSLISNTLVFFASSAGRRLITAGIYISGCIVLVLALNAAIITLAEEISTTMPASVAAGFAFFLPDNMDTCISIITSANFTRWLFDWRHRVFSAQLGVANNGGLF